MEEEDGGWKVPGKDVGSDGLQASGGGGGGSTAGLAVLQGQAQHCASDIQSQGRIQKHFC